MNSNKHRFIGVRYDGGHSPLEHADIGEWGAAFPMGTTGKAADPHTALHPILNVTTEFVVRDLERLVEGRFDEPFESDIVRRMIERQKIDVRHLRRMGTIDRLRLHDKIVEILRKQIADRSNVMLRGTMIDGLTIGDDSERVQMPGGTQTTIGRIRAELASCGMSIEKMRLLSSHQQDKWTRRVEREIRERPRAGEDDARAERTALHQRLREWARGPLVLEHPQSSSYHHLVEYESRTVDGDEFAKKLHEDPPQLFVVERDWARAFAGYELGKGIAPLPFPYCVFEFRISGVRVLAFYTEERMFCVYGRDGVWVCDDFNYDIESGARFLCENLRAGHEFERVSKLVRDNVRVACIMVDASVATRTSRSASPALVTRRLREGKPAPRSYHVIDLKRRAHTVRVAAPVSGGASRSPQGGHFRRGNWFWYDDQDSGKEQCVNSGGFIVSRTWRSWYFAGDPDRMIEREYRL